MNVEIKGIHLEVTQANQDYIDMKMPRLDFAKDLIVDFLLNLTREKNLFKVDATLNFRWGASIHIGVENFDLNTGHRRPVRQAGGQGGEGKVEDQGAPQEARARAGRRLGQAWPPRSKESSASWTSCSSTCGKTTR